MSPRSTPVPILLVEDDEIVAPVIAHVLGTLGEVHLADSGEAATALARRHDWDLIVADVELPGMSGIDLLSGLKRSHPHVAKLVLSGHSSFDYAVAALRAGADDYMTKPVDPSALVEKATELIEMTRERRRASREVVLAVGAHPDDVEIGVGGILLRHAAEGHSVSVLTLSGGGAGGIANQRVEESKRAAALLQAKLVMADFTDTSISEGDTTIGAIKTVIDDIGATMVYTHTARDVHQDHRSVHSATLVAARRIPRIYCYQAPSTTVEFHPTRFVAIDEFLERKLEVIHSYSSQVKVRRYLEEDLLRATARYWSRFSQARYVEPLEVVRESDVSPPVAHAGGTTGAPREVTLGARV